MKIKRAVVLAGLIGIVILGFARSRDAAPQRKPSPEQLREAFPGDSRITFEQSDRFILYSIKPMPGSNQDNTFHNYPILGQMEINDKKVKAGLTAQFYDGMATEDIDQASCFSPRHAIRAIKGQKVVDLVICFSCSGVEIYAGKDVGRTNVGPSPQRFYDAVLKDAGIPLAH